MPLIIFLTFSPPPPTLFHRLLRSRKYPTIHTNPLLTLSSCHATECTAGCVWSKVLTFPWRSHGGRMRYRGGAALVKQTKLMSAINLPGSRMRISEFNLMRTSARGSNRHDLICVCQSKVEQHQPPSSKARIDQLATNSLQSFIAIRKHSHLCKPMAF